MTANYRAATIKPSVKPSHRGYWMEHLIAISAALHQPYLHIFGDDKDESSETIIGPSLKERLPNESSAEMIKKILR